MPLRTPAPFTWRHLSIRLPTLYIQHVPVNPCLCPSRVTKLYIRLWDLGFEFCISQAAHDSRDMHLSAAKSEGLLTPDSQNLQQSILCIGDLNIYVWISSEDILKCSYFTEGNTAYKLRKPRFRNLIIWNYTQTFTSSSLHNIY